MKKRLIPYFSILNGSMADSPEVLSALEEAYQRIDLENDIRTEGKAPAQAGSEADAAALASQYADNGADALIIFDRSSDDASHDKNVAALAAACKASGVPVAVGGHMNRLEDVKKALYAGCRAVILNGAAPRTEALLKEASERFGKDKIYVSFDTPEALEAMKDSLGTYASAAVLMAPFGAEARRITTLPLIEMAPYASADQLAKKLNDDSVMAVSGGLLNKDGGDLHGLKADLIEKGINMEVPVSQIAWKDFKLNSDGLIPVISQDALTDEVLILAYMNEEAFDKTLKTGKMTYFSRSRQCIWTKGETSGHYQYVRSLRLDCDNDTILARVIQIGPACHTGRKSCFYQDLYEKTGPEKNARHVLDDVYAIIADRKVNPREGSYTNYLFDKGLDKILKKVGEENTELIIASKNPDASEIRYEISDYLYHLMVLMVEKGVTWDEIADELARR